MPAITTLLAVGLGAAGTAVQVSQQKKAEKAAAASAKKQETKALEAAKLKGPEQQDLKVKLGADGVADKTAATSSNKKGVSSTNSGVEKRVGTALGNTRSASAVGGL